MTNTSVKNSIFVLSAIALAAVLSLGAFAVTVHADDYVSAPDYSGDSNIGYADLGGGGNYVSAPDYSGNYVSAPDYSGNYVSAPDYSGNYVSAPDYSGNYVSAPDYSGDYVSAPDSSGNSVTDYYGTTDVYGNQTIDQGGVAYSTENYANQGYSSSGYSSGYSSGGYSSGSYSTPSYSQPISYSQPSYVSHSAAIAYPTSYAYPTTYAQPQQIAQTRTIAQPTTYAQPINIVNTNTNINTNTAPVTPVYQAPVQYPVQYVYPQQPTYYQQQPYCTITASNGYYNGTQVTTLSWSSSNATYATISPNVGNVAVNGSTNVYLNASGNYYTMTVSGQGGTNTCRTTAPAVYVQPNVTPSVSLTQIPYTGFDYGTFGDSIYWASLLSFAVAAAYLLVYYRGGAFTFATALAGVRRSRSNAYVASEDTEVATDIEETPADAVTEASVPVAPIMQNVSMRNNTVDSMAIAYSQNGEAPRIVITRS